MSVTTSSEGNKQIIKIKGRFDFNQQSDFRKAYESLPSQSNFVLDFSGTDYMDSSALGMLLLLRDYAGGDSSKMEIIRCSAEIKSILEISNFHQLFKIS
jgi:anti-anti-sigma factor